MSFNVQRLLPAFFLIAASVFLSACASDKMMTLTTPPPVATTPPQGQSTLVLFRSSFFGGAVQSSVFDVTDGQSDFIGIISAGKKVTHTFPAGERRVMALGENASFIDIDTLPGKVYYARVSPRMGLWKARFVLEPVPAGDPALEEELASCEWVGNTPTSTAWAQQNIQSALIKMREYLPEFESDPNRAMLSKSDGR